MPSDVAETMPSSGDEYAAILAAAGPGAAFCAVLCAADAGKLSVAGLMGCYLSVLLIALPGLPPFAVCLVRALPQRAGTAAWQRMVWGLFAVPALGWHLAAFDVVCVACVDPAPIVWGPVVRWGSWLAGSSVIFWLTQHARGK